MADNRAPRIDLERARRGPTPEDLRAMPATTAADWADATVILPVDPDIFEEASAKQRARAASAGRQRDTIAARRRVGGRPTKGPSGSRAASKRSGRKGGR